jgi:hypothetical protein
MEHDGGWRRRSSRYLFESPWFRLRQDEITLPNGDEITYTLVDHGGYVVVVPVLADGRGRALRGEIEDGPSALAILLAAARLDP